MNKTELIKPVAEAAGISQTQAKAAIEKVFDTLVESLKNGENATLLGFGSRSSSSSPAHVSKSNRKRASPIGWGIFLHSSFFGRRREHIVLHGIPCFQPFTGKAGNFVFLWVTTPPPLLIQRIKTAQNTYTI